MIFKPLNDNVLAIPEKAKAKTHSGIWLLDPTKSEQPRTAKVIAVGDKVKRVSIGERILFQAFASTDLKVGDDEYLAIREEFVIATIKGGKDG